MKPTVLLATVKVLIDEPNQRNRQRQDREYPRRAGQRRSKLDGTGRQVRALKERVREAIDSGAKLPAASHTRAETRD